MIGLAFKGNPETSDLRDSTSIQFLELFKNKKAAIVSAVLGKGGNSYNAYSSLSSQLENYGLKVFKDFYLFSSNNNLEQRLKENTQIKEFNNFLDDYLKS